MPYLIDGYNLLFATGRLTAKSPRHSLDSARKALLIDLTAGHGADISEVTVVFDAAGAPQGIPQRDEHGGARVLFSRQQSADDLIEELIRGEANSRSLIVVSDDHRIQQAARRRGCVVLGCLDYYEKLHNHEIHPPAPPPAAPPTKPQPSPEETQRWLDAFKEADEQDLF
jgi:predicted RNA-binding protein with PIN domain